MSRTIATEPRASAAEPPPVAARSLTLQRLRAEKLARASLLLFVLLAGVALCGTEFNQQLDLVHHATGGAQG